MLLKIIFVIIIIYNYIRIKNQITTMINKHYNKTKEGEITIHKTPKTKYLNKKTLNLDKVETVNYQEVKNKE